MLSRKSRMNNKEKPRNLHIGEYQIRTCKWCYLQIFQGNEDNHKKCNKKKARVMHSRKRNIAALEKSMDSKHPGRTSNTAIRVISAEGATSKYKRKVDDN